MLQSKTIIFILLIFFFIFYTNSILAQDIYWRPTNGPSCGTIKTLSSNGKYIFASMTSNGNIYRSGNYGNSWNLINPSLNPLYSAVIKDSLLFALCSNNCITLSTDYGTTWHKKYFSFPNHPQITKLWAFDDLLCIGTVDGFYFSEDDGDNWTGPVFEDDIVEEMLQENNLRIIGTSKGVYTSNGDNNYIFSELGYITALVSFNSILFAGNSNGVLYASFDNGLNWERRSNIYGGIVYSLTATDSLLLAGTQYSGIRFSADSGKTWFNTNNKSEYIYTLLTIDSIVFAGTRYDGLRISSDGGKSWEAGNIYSINVESLKSFNSILLASHEYSGNVYRSADYGQTWTTSKLNTPFIFDFAQGDNMFFTGARNGVFISYDQGLTWNINGSQLYDKNVFSVAYSNGILFAGIGGDGVYISNDLGSTWIHGNGINNEYVYDILATEHDIFVAATNGVYVSNDYGYNWKNIGPSGMAISIGQLDSTIFISGYFDGYKVIISKDWGNTWKEATHGFEGSPFYSYEFLTIDSIIYVGTNHGVYFTSLSNTGWKPFSYGLNDGREYVVTLAADIKNLYAGSNKNGISWRPFEAAFWELSNHFVSFENVLVGNIQHNELILKNTSDTELIVEKIYTTNPDFSVEIDGYSINPWNEAIISLIYSPKKLAEDKGFLIIETDGFYSADSVILNGLPISKNDISTLESIPTNYFIQQNYPNPFNSETTIKFGLPKAGNTILKVYNIRGSEVAELINQNIPEGNYKLTWKPQNIASGLYFISIRSNFFNKTIRMMYVK